MSRPPNLQSKVQLTLTYDKTLFINNTYRVVKPKEDQNGYREKLGLPKSSHDTSGDMSIYIRRNLCKSEISNLRKETKII